MEEETTLSNRDVLESAAGRAASTPGPGQPPGLGTRRRAARADRRAVRRHPRPIGPTDRPRTVGPPARPAPDRWCNAGWTDSAKLAVNLPPFVWLTSRGGEVTQYAPFTGPGRQTPASPPTSRQSPTSGCCWNRELQLGAPGNANARSPSIHSGFETRAHLPRRRARHAAADGDRGEFTLKSRAHLFDAIVRDLGGAPTRRSVLRHARLIPTLEEIATVARWQNIGVHRYPPLAAELAHRREPDFRPASP